MGLGYAALAQTNPGLIYCTISAYGPAGPYRNRPGFDFLIQAQSGIMSLNGPAESPPTRVGPVAVVDITTGLFASNAILAALLARKNDPQGAGQPVEVSLFETAFAWLSNVAVNYLITGQNQPRFGNKLSSVVPYQPFRCADGQEIILAIATDSQFTKFCKLIGHADLASDPRFARNGRRVKHRPELIKLLEEIFLSQPSGYWTELLINNDIPGGQVNTLSQALNDPHTQAIRLVEEITHPAVGKLKLVRSPLHLSKTPASIERHPPLLGEHTTEVLQGLGYSEQEQQTLKDKGVV